MSATNKGPFSAEEESRRNRELDREIKRPSHVAIRQAFDALGETGTEEVREALVADFEPFEQQMERRKGNRPARFKEHYGVLKRAGREKVAHHLATMDQAGLRDKTRRRRRKDTSRPIVFKRRERKVAA